MVGRVMVLLSVFLCLGYAVGVQAAEDESAWTQTFVEDKANLVSVGKNPFFSLEIGNVQKLQSKDGEESVVLVITVLNETKTVDGVETRIVEERESEDGKLIEVSRNYFAISKVTNSVYYFGEESNDYKDGKVVSQGGSWEAGVKGAKFGMFMPGVPLIGAKHYQEIAPGEAMDRAEIVSVTETVTVPAGKFENCLKILETSAVEKGKEFKYYAPGAGLLKDGELALISYGKEEKKEEKK